MNLNTIAEVKRPALADEISEWRQGYAWLAGWTWLFSEPQPTTDTLIDLEQLHWPALMPSAAGLRSPQLAASPSFIASPARRSGAQRRSCARAVRHFWHRSRSGMWRRS